MSEQLTYVTTQLNRDKDIITAEGDVKARIGVLWLVGILDVILAVGGIAAFLVKPENAKELWVIIGPIISGTASGVVGWWAAGGGQK